jgi:hypothetical protein
MENPREGFHRYDCRYDKTGEKQRFQRELNFEYRILRV